MPHHDGHRRSGYDEEEDEDDDDDGDGDDGDDDGGSDDGVVGAGGFGGGGVGGVVADVVRYSTIDRDTYIFLQDDDVSLHGAAFLVLLSLPVTIRCVRFGSPGLAW